MQDIFVYKFSDCLAACLRLLPAETAHDITLNLIKLGCLDLLPKPDMHLQSLLSGCAVNIPGIGHLQHPVGLAAGFDKNGVAIKPLVKLGFSFVEVGTVTPLPQVGNPKPRIFRQQDQLAIINRLGFNNDGFNTVKNRIEQLEWDHEAMPLGINIGKNAQTPDEFAVEEYVRGVETFFPLASYLVVNISSPNTKGLRSLANPDFIEMLAQGVSQRRDKVWIKLDPDMDKSTFQKVIEAIAAHNFQGLILTNTHRVFYPEPGGQSGHPLAVLSSKCLEWAYEVHNGKLPMIASGGVLSGVDIFEKLARGASAVQIYTALVYRGPWAVVKMLIEFSEELKNRGMECVDDVMGSYY